MKRYLLLMFLPLVLAACGTPSSNDGNITDPASAQAGDAGMAAPSLGAYHWQLSDATNSQGVRIDALFVRADKPVVLDFRESRVSAGNTCNNMLGGYATEGDQMTISLMASTMKACPDQNLMALDREVSSLLSGTLTFMIHAHAGNPPQLMLTTTGGDRLTFSGEPTAETRYGSDGETAFLEVASETKPCSHPSIPDMQCLQVREVYYDANGLKSGEPGEWQNFYQQIEGYTHQPGIRNVVRTKRYRIANPPADAPNTAYVLDMVVESELVKR